MRINYNTNMKYIKYEELRKVAVKEGIKDNKVSIGMYAKFLGYKKKKLQKDNKVEMYYYKEDDQINN